MSHAEWFYALVGSDSVNAASKKSGLIQTTVSRHLKDNQLTADEVIKLARTYRADVLDGLLACELVAREELMTRPISAALGDATDEELAREVLVRVCANPRGRALVDSLTD